jgi:hypothetical protein
VTREQFAHAVRAAGAILATEELLVIGSQALHASTAEPLPEEAARSVEVDIGALHDPSAEMADLIDGSIGEASMFHGTFGYFAQGIDATTAILPDGWRDRLVRFETPSTNGVIAWCLEPHDLWVAKMIAGRPKDLEFGRAILERGFVRAEVLRRRVGDVPQLDPEIKEAILGRVSAWASSDEIER